MCFKQLCLLSLLMLKLPYLWPVGPPLNSLQCPFNITPLIFFFFFLRFFWCGPFLTSLLNLLQYCFFFYVLVFWPRGMWDLSSPTRDQTLTPCIGRRSLNHWTAREVPTPLIFNILFAFWHKMPQTHLIHYCPILGFDPFFKGLWFFCVPNGTDHHLDSRGAHSLWVTFFFLI